jgi:hypothetical protein
VTVKKEDVLGKQGVPRMAAGPGGYGYNPNVRPSGGYGFVPGAAPRTPAHVMATPMHPSMGGSTPVHPSRVSVGCCRWGQRQQDAKVALCWGVDGRCSGNP